MYCIRCGAAQQPGQTFCGGCGQAVGNLPPAPPQNRSARHIRLLGILWLAISAFRMIPGVVLTVLFGNEIRFLPLDTPPFLIGIIQTLGFVFIAAAAIGVIAGWGLLEHQLWARKLTIVLGCLSMVFDVPFGTALGIYTLWVLLPAKSEEEFIHPARLVE